MRRFPIVILILTTLCLQQPMLAQEQPVQAPPFGLTETIPARTSLLVDSPMTFVFSRVLDCSTVTEHNITITPLVEVELACSLNAITLTPLHPLKEQTRYVVRVASDIHAMDGSSLDEDISILFGTPGFLRVRELLPLDTSIGILGMTPITVIFDRPVLALSLDPDDANPPAPFTISPAISGSGTWVNNFIYTFTPDKPMRPNTEYTVTVDEQLQTADGLPMVGPYVSQFMTSAPSLTRVFPSDKTQAVPLGTRLKLDFSVPVPQAAIEQNFYLRPADFPDEYRVPGTWKWDEAGTSAVFTTTHYLTLQTAYDAGIQTNQLQVDDKPWTLDGHTNWTFTTVPYPQFIKTYPADGQTVASGGFSLEFNTFMDANSITDHLTIEPEPPNGYFTGYQNGNTYAGIFDAQPSTTYTIRVTPGYEDLYGHLVNTPIEFQYTTLPASPIIRLATPGFIGFYNAYYDMTALFVRHRNVASIDLKLYTVELAEFMDMLTLPRTESPKHPSETLIRARQIDLTAEENITESTLLNLSEQNTACGTAPASRLRIGDYAEILPGQPVAIFRGHLPPDQFPELTSTPTPISPTAVFTPTVSAVAMTSTPTPIPQDVTVYPGFTVEIIGETYCLDGNTRLWRVQLDDGATGWIAENAGSDYVLEPVHLTTSRIAVNDPEDADEALAPGVYRLAIGSNAGLEHYMLVSTAVLTVKATLTDLTVWATDVATAQPIPHVPIRIYNAQGILAGGITDADGLVTMTVPFDETTNLYNQNYFAVLSTPEHFGIGAAQWSIGIDPGNFNMPSDYGQDDHVVYLYTDRPIYRPGNTVYYRGIIRRKEDMRYYPPDITDVRVAFYNGSDEIFRKVKLSASGSFSGSFKLTDDAILSGYYTVRVTADAAPAYHALYSEIGFAVAEFRLPEFAVTLTPEARDVVQGDTIRVMLDSRYYFGSSVANADVEYSIITQPYSFSYQGKEHYGFTPYVENAYVGYDEYYGYQAVQRRIAEGNLRTDDEGQAVIEFPAELSLEDGSQNIIIEATVKDKTDHTVTGAAVVTVHRGTTYIGSRLEKYVVQKGEATTVHLIAVDVASQPISGLKLDAELVQVKWNNVQERDEQGRTAWVWERELVPVAQAALTTDGNGKVDYKFTPEKGGTYQLITRTRDSHGNPVTNAISLWVASSDYVAWQEDNNNRIELIADAESYNIGDTAKILITSPFQGEATAWITVERAGILTRDVIALTHNAYLYELPVLDDYAPNVFVSVIIMKGVDEHNPVAALRMGTLRLKVSTRDKVIHLTLNADTLEAQPQQTVTYTVKATDAEGNPVRAEVGVAVTDAAALAVAKPNYRDLLSFFYSETGLRVRTGSALTMNTDAITQRILDAIKGGGGGTGLPYIFDVRDEFVNTPYWNATLTTDLNGEATFSVKLPDNLTTWRLDAKAITLAEDGDLKVGQATLDIVSTRPLLIRPVTPRFFVVGDVVTLAAVVNNSTDEVVTARVSLQATGVILLDRQQAAQSVSVPAQSSVRVEWQARVQNVLGVGLIFAVKSSDGRYEDATQPVLAGAENLLPVYRYEVPATVATSGILRDASQHTETINLPDGWDITEGELTLQVDTSLAASSIQTLHALETYRYRSDNIPHIVSLLLPNVATYRAVTQLELAYPTLQQQVEAEVDFALQRLYTAQKPDGGWGWYRPEASDPMTTAYALIGLARAEAVGFPIEDKIIGQAQRYLQNSFIVPDLSQPNSMLNRQAFFLYALAMSGQPDVARMANLFEVRDRLNLDAQVYLALALHRANPQDARLAALIANFVSRATVSATGMHWDETFADPWNWSTDTRTTALVLHALITLNPKSDLIPQGIRWLMAQREHGAWVTDQESAWAVLALTDWMLLTDELQPDFSYTVTFNEGLLTLETASTETTNTTEIYTIPVSDMQPTNQLTFTRTDGAGVLYYTGRLRALLPVPEITALDQGIFIQREYSLLSDPDAKPITRGHVGDLLRVKLTMIAPTSLHYVTIDDPLPAGSEAIDPRLPTEPGFENRFLLNRTAGNEYGWGWWYFQNREYHDEKVRLSASYLASGTYEVVYTLRLGLPGVYNVIPPTVQETYFPEVYGRGAGMAFTILPALETGDKH